MSRSFFSYLYVMRTTGVSYRLEMMVAWYVSRIYLESTYPMNAIPHMYIYSVIQRRKSWNGIPQHYIDEYSCARKGEEWLAF